MFYVLDEKEIRQANLEETEENVTGVAYLTLEELKEQHENLGISSTIVADCIADQTHFRTGIDIYDECSYGIINIVNVMNVNDPKDRIAFIIKKNQFYMVKLIDSDDSTKDMFENAVGRFRQNATLEKVIYGILERLLANGNKALEIMEQKIMEMEQRLIDGHIKQDLNKEIFKLRHDVSIQKNYYEQLYDIGVDLQENENGLFDKEDLRYFKIFADKAERLSDNTKLLQDSLIHLRETLDASLNYSLNNKMQVFTIVTTIFSPLTLIVGWYGMNFKYMPEISWKYGYFAVILLSFFVVMMCLVLFKKKKLF